MSMLDECRASPAVPAARAAQCLRTDLRWLEYTFASPKDEHYALGVRLAARKCEDPPEFSGLIQLLSGDFHFQVLANDAGKWRAKVLLRPNSFRFPKEATTARG